MDLTALSLLLLAGFVASMAASALQHRYYLRTVNRLAAREHRAGLTLISGRATGRLRGTVVLLLVRSADDVVEGAQVMQGASVFARFRERPELAGPLATAPARAPGKALSRAVEDARDRYHRMNAGRAAAERSRTGRARDAAGAH